MDALIEINSKIIALSKNAGMSQRNIALHLSVAHSTAYQLLRYQAAFKTTVVNRNGKCGSKRKSRPVDDQNLFRESKINPQLTSSKL